MTGARLSWDDYFLGLVTAAGARATCDRGRSGCVIAKDNFQLMTGYVGSLRGQPHCDDAGHLLTEVTDEDGISRTHCVRTAHAEQNAITNAARRGIAIDGATLYCSMEPCRNCAFMIVSSGITRVVCLRRYHAGQAARQIFTDCDVTLEVRSDVVEYEGNGQEGQ